MSLSEETLRRRRKEFIRDALLVHGNKYDYSKVIYSSKKKRVIIICPYHGEFTQTPFSHLKTCGCPKCAHEKSVGTRWSNYGDEFKIKAATIHNDKYSYDQVSYLGTYGNVKIKCPKHGEFLQTPSNHLIGHGCSKCAFDETDIELEVKGILESLGVDFRVRDREIIKPLELDFLLTDHSIAIECNGLFWHSELAGKNKFYHINKTELCNNAGLRLIHLNEFEIRYRKRIVISRIKSILGIGKRRIWARKCSVGQLDGKTKSAFLRKYHIQGDDSSSIFFGLFYRDKLVSVMTFGPTRISLGTKNKSEDEYELIRYCGNFGFTVVGGASKLLSGFEKTYSPTKIVSYADRRWSQGKVYEILGFAKVKATKPNYYYFRNDGSLRMYHRYSFRKSVLSRKLKNFEETKTEWQNMKSNGWNRIWDCGSFKYEKHFH